MATPPRPVEQKLSVKARVEDKLRQGYRPKGLSGPGPGAIAAAAEDAVREGEFASPRAFITAVHDLTGDLEPDWSLYRPRQYLQAPVGSPVIAFQDHIVEDDPEGEPEEVAVIGDAHDSPHLKDKSRFYWLGAFIAERGIKRVVSAGDWVTLDSFSSHTDRATFAGLAKPIWDQDLESFHASQRAFQAGLAGHKPKLDITMGNHEFRAVRYDNSHPDGASHARLLEEAFAQWGWRTTPYGEFRFIGGVGFIHAPLQPASDKPYGGKTGGQRAANDTMFDIIRGDDHRHTVSVGDKIGPFPAPMVYSAATALPPGYIEGYARKGASSWRSGVCVATIWGGRVRSWSFTEMVLLRRRYGRHAA